MSIKIRNPIAHAPIMRKGSVHVKTKSSQRAQIKEKIKQASDEWIYSRSIN